MNSQSSGPGPLTSILIELQKRAALIGGFALVFAALAAVFVMVKSLLSQVTEEYNLFFGIFFMLVVAFFRGGIGGALRSLTERLR